MVLGKRRQTYWMKIIEKELEKNEVFKTKYAEDQKFEQLHNAHYEKFGKIATYSIIRIGERLYHIECQTKRDGDMALRMVEYDFTIAVENSKTEDGSIEIDFPESCVLYIRNHSGMPDHHTARIRFSDGQTDFEVEVRRID